MSTTYQQIVEALKEGELDVIKGYGGNKAATARGRKALQNVSDLIKEARKELSAVRRGEVEGVSIRPILAGLDSGAEEEE